MQMKLSGDMLAAYTNLSLALYTDIYVPTNLRKGIPRTEQSYYTSTAALLQLHSRISRSSNSYSYRISKLMQPKCSVSYMRPVTLCS